MHDMEQLYKEYFNSIYKYLYCLTHSEDIAEELTQETFYRAIKKIHTFQNDCKISVWLCQIAKNLWYDELKKRKKIKYISEEEKGQIELEEQVENDIYLKEKKLQLYQRMQQLNEQTREVIYLRITGELSFKEIGQILGKTENWARTVFYRGKEKLKEKDINEKRD